VRRPDKQREAGIVPGRKALVVRSVLRSTLLIALLVGGLGVSLITGTPASAATTLERALVSKINASRAVYGLRALPIRSGLTWRAHDHSLAMARQHRLYHSDLTKVCCYRSVGENVGYATTLYRVHRALMNSPAHRSNIMGTRWDSIGVGVVQSGGYLWVTEIFRQPS
jgi:uncharacterized protein YkwD